MAKAYALVLPDRDAQILAKALNAEYHTLDKIHYENVVQYTKPMIVGVSEASLPNLLYTFCHPIFFSMDKN